MLNAHQLKILDGSNITHDAILRNSGLFYHSAKLSNLPYTRQGKLSIMRRQCAILQVPNLLHLYSVIIDDHHLNNNQQSKNI